MRVFMWRGNLSRIFGEMWLVELAMAVPHGSGASRQSVVGISEPRVARDKPIRHRVLDRYGLG